MPLALIALKRYNTKVKYNNSSGQGENPKCQKALKYRLCRIVKDRFTPILHHLQEKEP